MDGQIQKGLHTTQSGAETVAPEALPAPTKSEQGRPGVVPPGGIITTGAGYLRRTRPDTYHHRWSKVPVGPVAAQELSKGLTERDHLILLMAEQSRVLTIEQVERAFFTRHITARKRIRLLRERRFLATPEVDHRVLSAAVGRRAGTHNAPLVLDWNGKYLLEHLHYDLRSWDPATVAQVNSQFGHTLGVSEVWSYIAAAARATHERVPQVGAAIKQATARDAGDAGDAGESKDTKNQLAIGLLNERESVVYYEGCTGWSLELRRAKAQGEGTDSEAGVEAQIVQERSKRWRYRPLVKPDATLVLSVTSGAQEREYFEAARKVNSKSPVNYQGSWHDALLSAIPPPAAMRAAEHLGSTRYRYVFVEMGTGTNSSRDMVHKIGRYNRLYSLLTEGDMMHGQSWRTLFGSTLPTIIVAVRDRSQVEGQVMLWRTHYSGKSPGTVILANLELLAFAYARGRSRLLTQRCWLDVMRPEGPKWSPLGDILGLRL